MYCLRRSADIVDVTGSQTFLAGGGSGEFELASSEKMVFELIHAGGREQDGRVPPWHEHVTGLADAALGFKKGEIFFAKFVGFHGLFEY